MDKSVWTIQAKKQLSDNEVAALAGTLLTDEAFHTLIDRDCDVTGPDGEFLLRFRKKVLRADDCYTAWKNLRSAATQSDNRGIAAGVFEESEIRPNIGKRSDVRYYQAKQDGTISNTNRAKTVNSGIIGFFDRNPRIPYCRQTAFNIQKGDQFDKALPMIQAISGHFERLMPERWAAQKSFCDRTSPDFLIPGTVFSTITVNKNWQTAVHQDAGDLRAGFGVLTALRAGRFTGGYFCLPQYGVAVDLDSTDLLLANVHEWHGNTPIKAIDVRFERVSLVFYYREQMTECGSALEEAEIAKRRKPGSRLKGKLQ